MKRGQHGKSATREKVQHEKRDTQKQCKMKKLQDGKVQHEMCTTQKKSENLKIAQYKKVQYRKSATRNQCNTQNKRIEGSAT